MNRKNLIYLVTGLSSILALFFHVYLVWEYFKVKYAIGGAEASLCSFSEAFDCSAVAASPYSSLFGIPIAQFGLWSNLIFTIILISHWVTAHFSNKANSLTSFGLLSLSGVLAFGSLIMGSISALIMQTYCAFCIATYFLSAVTSVGAWILVKPNIKILPNEFKPSWLIILILIPIGSWLTHAIIMDQLGGKRLPIVIEESVLEWKSNPQLSFDLSSGIAFGTKTDSAQHIIVEFVDLFCPHCKFASYPLKAFTKARSDVALIVKIFPLDGTCNSALGSGDGFRCKWSSVALCANDQNRGQQVLNWIFEHQSELSRMPFEFGLKALQEKSIELNEATLAECLNSETTLSRLKSMAEEGQKANVKGTPTIFLNGRQLPRGQVIPVLEAAISQ